MNKEKVLELYSYYKQLEIKKNNKYDMIKGSLNNIAVTDNEQQVINNYNALINYTIKEYVEIVRKTHNAFNNYWKALEIYKETEK